MTDRSTAGPVRSSAGVIAAGVLSAVLVSIALNTAIAGMARAAGASPAFSPLDLPTYSTWTTLGVVAGFAGWAVVRSRATRPRRLMRVLVPAVIVTSWVPDLVLGLTGSLPGTSWVAVIALMLMHVVIGAVVVIICVRLLPLPEGA